MKKATNISRDALACLGTCIGRFTHHKNFHLVITCLPVLAEHAQVRDAEYGELLQSTVRRPAVATVD